VRAACDKDKIAIPTADDFTSSAQSAKSRIRDFRVRMAEAGSALFGNTIIIIIIIIIIITTTPVAQLTAHLGPAGLVDRGE
jgi:hypothetical protein